MLSSNAIEQLEWPRFLAKAADLARSMPARARVESWREPANWAPSVASAQLRQAETSRAAAALASPSLWDCLENLADPAASLERLGRGATLDLAELVAIRRWLDAMETWDVTQDALADGKLQRLLPAFASPVSRHPAARELLRKWLTPEGELSEQASPRLAALNQEIRALKREIAQVLDGLLKRYHQKGILQENFSDVRDGRFVIPLKISSQNEIDGIVYETSVSRQTAFVEPPEVAALNQRLKKRQGDLAQEVYALLTQASRAIESAAGEIAAGVEQLTHWDAVQARARLAEAYGGYPIEVTERREFALERAAHPLLWFAEPALPEIIRNTLAFGGEQRALLLTGPNTGGKTVLLKGLGFAALCARTGFFFPASPSRNPLVPFCDQIFADLGDPQSLEKHLSSFSGHILRFKEILDGLTGRSLVLMDELNSATDPEEGAALGRAFLETLIERQALIVATTHDPSLKALALEDPRILNASLEFDESSRSPTYKIALGVPGRSRAIETAERLGLPAKVIALARQHLTHQHRRLEDLLARLESDAHGARADREQAQSAREDAERLQREWKRKTSELAHGWIDQARQKLRRTLEQAQERIREQALKLEQARDRKQVQDVRSSVSQAFTEGGELLGGALEEEIGLRVNTPAPPPTTELEIGTPVRIARWKTVGTVLEAEAERVKVAAGALQAWLPWSEVEATGGKPKAKSTARVAHLAAIPPSQIDLRGMRLDDALTRLGSYLDQAYRSQGLKSVTVVHGVGTGAVREGARKLIASLPYVQDYRDGGAGGGGTGATIVEFDL